MLSALSRTLSRILESAGSANSKTSDVKLEQEQLAFAGGAAHPSQTRPLILEHVHLPNVVIYHQVDHGHCLLLLLDTVPDTYKPLMT